MRPLLATAMLTVEYVRMLAVLPSKIECRQQLIKLEIKLVNIVLLLISPFIIHNQDTAFHIPPTLQLINSIPVSNFVFNISNF